MSKRIILHQPSSNRRQPLLASKLRPSSTRFAEFAGECTAVCCCCPCTVVSVVLLALYTLPAGLYRRAMKIKRKRNMIKKGLWAPQPRCSCGCAEDLTHAHPFLTDEFAEMEFRKSEESERAVVELEKEMWARFYGTGFWRSSSQRDLFQSSTTTTTTDITPTGK